MYTIMSHSLTKNSVIIEGFPILISYESSAATFDYKGMSLSYSTLDTIVIKGRHFTTNLTWMNLHIGLPK